MNIDFLKIADFCTTKNQIKLIEKLKKKFSIKSTTDLDRLSELLMSFLVNDNHEPLAMVFQELVKFEFKNNFEIWGLVEAMAGIMNEAESISDEEKLTLFNLFKAVTEYKNPPTQEMLDSHIDKRLSLYFVNGSLDELNRVVLEGDVKYEYDVRLWLLSDASQVKIVNQGKDKELEDKMNKIIAEQLQYLKEPRLLKYS